MIKLYRLADAQWRVNPEGKDYQVTGSLPEVCEALRELYIMEDEISMAVTEMFQNNHTVATFGVDRMFVYSS